MQHKVFDTTHPYNLGNENFRLRIKISPKYITQVNAVEIWGRAVRIKMHTAEGIQMIPNKPGQLGIWTKGSPADVVYERLPFELKIIEIKQIEQIIIDVSNI